MYGILVILNVFTMCKFKNFGVDKPCVIFSVTLKWFLDCRLESTVLIDEIGDTLDLYLN